MARDPGGQVNRKTLILHIGSHKTGSTALQSAFAANRRKLLKAGVFYPRRIVGGGWRGGVHRDLYDAAIADARRPAGQAPTFEPLLDRYIARIEAANAPVAILSCEAWSGAQNLYAPRFSRLTDRFDVRIVYFFRRADLLAESMYKQLTKNQALGGATFDDYIAQHMPGWITGRSRMLGWWAEAFGSAAVTVAPYEPAAAGFDLFEAFFAATDLAGVEQRLRRDHARNRNPSLTRGQAEVLRRLHVEGRKLSRWRLQLLQRLDADDGPYLGDASRARLRAAAAKDTAAVAAAYVRDGRRDMFPTPPEKSPRQDADWRPDMLDPTIEARIRQRLFLRSPD